MKRECADLRSVRPCVKQHSSSVRRVAVGGPLKFSFAASGEFSARAPGADFYLSNTGGNPSEASRSLASPSCGSGIKHVNRACGNTPRSPTRRRERPFMISTFIGAARKAVGLPVLEPVTEATERSLRPTPREDLRSRQKPESPPLNGAVDESVRIRNLKPVRRALPTNQQYRHPANTKNASYPGGDSACRRWQASRDRKNCADYQ